MRGWRPTRRCTARWAMRSSARPPTGVQACCAATSRSRMPPACARRRSTRCSPVRSNAAWSSAIRCARPCATTPSRARCPTAPRSSHTAAARTAPTSTPDARAQEHATGRRAAKQYQLFNGALECSLVVCDPVRAAVRDDAQPRALSEGAQMLANRLRKNLRNIKSWRAREGVECFRAYDADLPEYAAAIDVYPEADDPDTTWLDRKSTRLKSSH